MDTTSVRASCDGLRRFAGIKTVGCGLEAIVTGGGHAGVASEALTWVKTMIGNVKSSIQGTYHGIGGQHSLRYPAELCYRFDRRFELSVLIPRLVGHYPR